MNTFNILLQAAAIGGFSSLIQTVAILVAITYFATPITLIIIILVYEMLLRFDIAGAAGNLINKITARASAKIPSLSVLPTLDTTKSADHNTLQDILKLDNPINVFLNINRAFLYIALLLSFTTLWPISTAFHFPPDVYISLFNFINYFVVSFEPIFLLTLILIFAPINIYIDVIIALLDLFAG